MIMLGSVCRHGEVLPSHFNAGVALRCDCVAHVARRPPVHADRRAIPRMSAPCFARDTRDAGINLAGVADARVGFVALFERQAIFLRYSRCCPSGSSLLQRPLNSEVWVLFLAGIGFWTVWRGNHWPGRAAIRVSTIASLPLVLIGLLMLAGVLDFIELHPRQTPTTFEERGILYTFYKGRQQVPGSAPIVMLLSPLLRLPGAWLWGVVGGGIAHWISRARRRQTASV